MELARLDPFASRHHGLVTRPAFRAAGFSDRSWYRALEAGVFELVHRNVARLVGTERTREQAICAAVLTAGVGAMASHRSAAHLWGIVRPDDDPIDVLLVPRTREAHVDGAFVHRPRDRKDLTPGRRLHIPTTNILRTLCDLGAVDAPAVTDAVGHVVTTGLASPAALRAAINRHARRGRPGVPALREALDEWVIDGKPVDSQLEKTMNRLLATHHLPPAAFHPIVGGYEVDFQIIGSPIVLECDGWSTHGLNRLQFEKDRVRDAELTALGTVVVRFTYRALVHRPAKEAARIRRVVERWAPHLLGGNLAGG